MIHRAAARLGAAVVATGVLVCAPPRARGQAGPADAGAAPAPISESETEPSVPAEDGAHPRDAGPDAEQPPRHPRSDDLSRRTRAGSEFGGCALAPGPTPAPFSFLLSIAGLAGFSPLGRNTAG